MISNISRCLVLAPHTDDGEFGCGATLARLVKSGTQVTYVAFSDCAESLPAGWPPDTLVREVRAAMAVIGVPSDQVIVHRFSVRHFKRDRQEILELLVRLNQELNPQLVFLPSTNDLHQDHQTIYEEGLRAFKKTTLLSYEIPWNNIQFSNELFVVLDEEHVAAKVNAIACYKSQAGRSYAREELIRAQALMRGGQIGCRFAEAFEVVRAIAR
jgi:LmbE family N-acetylglucosaminyl deacetylase